MDFLKRYVPHGMTVFIAIIFLDSLRYKFTNHPNTQEIFGRLNEWSASWGADGLFAQSGLFSQYVIGTAELVASLILLSTMVFKKFRFLQPLGALLGLAIMTGAISFHLFTPLGIDPNNDGGGLFMAACTVWVFCAALLFIRRAELKDVIGRLCVFLKPAE